MGERYPTPRRAVGLGHFFICFQGNRHPDSMARRATVLRRNPAAWLGGVFRSYGTDFRELVFALRLFLESVSKIGTVFIPSFALHGLGGRNPLCSRYYCLVDRDFCSIGSILSLICDLFSMRLWDITDAPTSILTITRAEKRTIKEYDLLEDNGE
jgi:hypothetical protein